MKLRWLVTPAIYPTVEEVKELREKTGLGFIECKNKLTIPEIKTLQFLNENKIWENIPIVIQNDNVQEPTLVNVVKFDQFLLDNNCYRQFYDNFNPAFAGYKTVQEHLESSIGYWIVCAFDWEKSPQKHEYWKTINDLWEKSLS